MPRASEPSTLHAFSTHTALLTLQLRHRQTLYNLKIINRKWWNVMQWHTDGQWVRSVVSQINMKWRMISNEKRKPLDFQKHILWGLDSELYTRLVGVSERQIIVCPSCADFNLDKTHFNIYEKTQYIFFKTSFKPIAVLKVTKCFIKCI